MNIYDYIDKIKTQPIDAPFTKKLEKIYGNNLTEYVKKALSIIPNGYFFEGDDILQLLSHQEILDSSEELSVDFVGQKIIPVFDTGDNDYIVFDISNDCWCKFNIVDLTAYKPRKLLDDYFV